MSDYREEETFGKAYDSRLTRRLLRFAKPYWRLILLSALLIGFVTSADLAPPYLSQIAIDNYIGGISTPMATFTPGSAPHGAVVYDGVAYVRTTSLAHPPTSGLSEIVASHGREYLVSGLTATSHVIIQGGEGFVSGAQLPTVPLSAHAVLPFRQQDETGLLWLGIIYALVVIVAFASNYGQTLILQWCGQRIIFNIRSTVFQHVEGMHLQFFDRNPIGRLVTRVTNDTEALNEMYTSVLVNIFKDAFLLVGSIVIMFVINRTLAFVAYAIIPFLVLMTAAYSRFARDAYRTVRVRLARLNAFLSENFSGMRVVQVMRRVRRQNERFDAENQGYLKAGIRELTIFAVFRPSMTFMYNVTVAALLWWGGLDVLHGVVAFGVLYAFVGYAQQFFQPINDIADKYQIMQSAMAASERIFQVIDTPREVVDRENALSLTADVRGEVRFENVSFAYLPEEWVLRDVSFTIQPGQSVAFVGATGAGKSSIVNLIGRFYDIQKGRVLVDGRDVREYDQHDLRRTIGVVQQDVFLFSGNIRDNIRLGDEMPDSLVEAAARQVHADSFIERLPGGYDAPVQERGSTFSAGQRQLIAFARVLAHDPAVLVLDEATASIDTETEQHIQAALERVSRDRTTLIVAHRLSTIQHCDQIFVMHRGRIVEHGTHQELVARHGLYYDLYRLQYPDGGSGAEPSEEVSAP